jgi:DNA topoisomerase-1
MPEIEFQVGKTYSNRIGEYKVLKIDRSAGRMDVCFLEGGEHKSLDMTIQSRIRRNMILDAQRAEKARLEEKASRAKAAKKTTTKKTAVKKTAAPKTTAKKATTKKTAAPKTAVKKTTAKKTAEPSTAAEPATTAV